MPIANCLPFLDSSATKNCFHPNVREGQTTDPESFVQYEHLDWNGPTAISLDMLEFFLNTQDRLEKLYQQWHNVAYVRQCSSFFTWFYVWTCINPKGWEYLGSQNMLDRHFGRCSLHTNSGEVYHDLAIRQFQPTRTVSGWDANFQDQSTLLVANNSPTKVHQPCWPEPKTC